MGYILSSSKAVPKGDLGGRRILNDVMKKEEI